MSSAYNIKHAVKEAFTMMAHGVKYNDLKLYESQVSYLRMIGYGSIEIGMLPKGVVSLAIGCGNPTASANLHEGEIVLDLGCGAGIDVLLAAKRVGSTGKAIGVDISEAIIEYAQSNMAQAKIENVQFIPGEIEALPMANNSVDVIISNATINLSPDKDAVFREAFRVLRAGGRMLICDIVRRGEFSPSLRKMLEPWGEWVLGPLDQADYLQKIYDAGFTSIEVIQDGDPEGISFIHNVSVRAVKTNNPILANITVTST